MKITPERLLEEIERMGGGEIAEFRLLRRLDISHGQFCQLRKELVAAGLLEVTHPNRKARYIVVEGAGAASAADAGQEKQEKETATPVMRCAHCPYSLLRFRCHSGELNDRFFCPYIEFVKSDAAGSDGAV